MEESLQPKNDTALQQVMDKKIEEFYEKYFQNVKNYIINNSGDLDDAKDVFQELAMIYFKMLSKPEFANIENEKNYILGITRNIWLKKIKDANKMIYNTEHLEHLEEPQSHTAEALPTNELMDIILHKLDEISEECRKIIHAAFYLKLSAVDIAVYTGYSEKFIKVKKFRCLQGLKKLVYISSEFKNLLN